MRAEISPKNLQIMQLNRMQSTYYYMRAVISPYDMLHARQYYKMDAERQK